MALPTHGDCRAMTAMRIEKGHFGDVDLGGVSWCGMFAWPKAIHEGNGEAFVVISEHATPAQRDALLTILSGQETVPGATIFNVFATTFVKMHDPVFAAIEFELDLDKRKGRVADRGRTRHNIEPIRNPITGEEHRAQIGLPKGSNTAKPSSPAAARARSGHQPGVRKFAFASLDAKSFDARRRLNESGKCPTPRLTVCCCATVGSSAVALC